MVHYVIIAMIYAPAIRPFLMSIVSDQTLQDIGATNLVDALRMVPGITFGAGEGGNSTGDRPFLRGFDGQSNMFVDGLRDVGTQTREVFNLEHSLHRRKYRRGLR